MSLPAKSKSPVLVPPANWMELVVTLPVLVTSCRSGVVPEGQLVPFKRQTDWPLIVVLEGRTAALDTYKLEPVDEPKNKTEEEAESTVKVPAIRASPTTSKVDEGLVVPMPTLWSEVMRMTSSAKVVPPAWKMTAVEAEAVPMVRFAPWAYKYESFGPVMLKPGSL